MKKILIGLILLASMSSFAKGNRCNTFIEPPFGGDFDHQEIAEEITSQLREKLNLFGYIIVDSIEDAHIVFEGPVTGCDRRGRYFNSECKGSYAMIDYSFTKKNDSVDTKKLRGSTVWKSKQDIKKIARRAFSGSHSPLFGKASQIDAFRNALEKINNCL